jgi:glycosyltransferase involved in cell wall biosynthesis
VRTVYERSGIPRDMIRVIPWGVDPTILNPNAPPWHLPTEKKFKFLYVGGTIARKGFDLLFESFCDEFGPNDDVCLVVKDVGTATFIGMAITGSRSSTLKRTLLRRRSFTLIIS